MAQILPVMRGLCVGDVLDHCLLAWEHWPERRALVLTKNMRAADDPHFAEWLSRVRDGSANVDGTDDIVVPEVMLVQPLHKPGKKAYKTHMDGNKTDEDGLMDGIIERVGGVFYLHLFYSVLFYKVGVRQTTSWRSRLRGLLHQSAPGDTYLGLRRGASLPSAGF